MSNDNLYVWLEDNAGNINSPGAVASRKLFIDTTPLAKPFNLNITPNPTLNPTPTITWEGATDPSGISHYIVCYWQAWAAFSYNDLLNLHNNINGSCPSSALLLGRTSYTVSPHKHVGLPADIQSLVVPVGQPISAGLWHFAIYEVDNSGNISQPSDLYSLALSDGSSRLSFTNENEDFSLGGISPRTGSTGVYSFKVRYTDTLDTAPIVAQVWVDANGDGTYAESEKHDMDRAKDGSTSDNANYFNGEDYIEVVNLTYNPATKGKINYRFSFQNANGASINGSTNGDPTIDNEMQLDPYDLNTFPGMMQVRNNVWRPGSIQVPTILLKPPANKADQIKVSIYDPDGRLIKTIINSGRYSANTRFVRWDLKSKSGRPVGAGVYTAVYFAGAERTFKKIIVLR